MQNAQQVASRAIAERFESGVCTPASIISDPTCVIKLTSVQAWLQFDGVMSMVQEQPKEKEPPWFKTPAALVDEYLDVLSDAACKFLLLLLRQTAGYKSYQEHPAPVRLSTRDIGEGRKNKQGTRIGKGTSKSKHTIIRVVRECQDLGIVYVEEDRRDRARIEKKYAPLTPGCVGPYCTLEIGRASC